MSAAAGARRLSSLCLAVLAMSASACGSRAPAARPMPLPVRGDVRPGDCADPTRQGVFGQSPSLRNADRDLDGDGVNEVVVADRSLCTPEGNCHWNLYRTEGECARYLGTVSAATIQRVSPRGDQGFYGVRAWWKLTGDSRFLLQEYRFRHGGYRLVEALLCHQGDDARVVCAEQGR